MEGEIYDPEDLIRQINGKINAIQEANRAKKIAVVDEESKEAKVKVKEVDELKILEKANEEERMLVGLISLIEKILRNVDAQVCDKIVED